MYLIQSILIYCLSFLVLAALTNANNLLLKNDVIKEPKVHVETVRIVQPKRSAPTNNDSPFMPVFLTSNVKAADFTQEMLKSLASTNSHKPSVKLTNKASNLSNNHKQSSRSSAPNKEANKNKVVKSETVVTRWSKAGTTSNFSPVMPINLSKMHFDTTGFIPIVPKQATRSSSNAKLIKQASKPISRPTVIARTVPLPKHQALAVVTPVKATSKRKTLLDLNTNAKLTSSKESGVLQPNPSVRALKAAVNKSNAKQLNNAKPIASSKPMTTVVKLTASKPKNSNANKHVDNRPISAAASSSELNSYLSSHLNSRDARKALLKMNTLRYLAKLSPQWSASSLSETYQSKLNGASSSLKAYPIGKITVPADQGSYGGSSYKKPEISVELIKEILHKLTNDEVQFNKLYVMGTHRYKGQNGEKQYDQSGGQEDGGYNQENNESGYQGSSGGEYQQDGVSYQDQGSSSGGEGGYQQEGGYSQGENAGGAGYTQPESGGYNQPESGGYNQPESGGYNQPESGGYNQPESGGYTQPESGGYNQPESGGYSQPDYSQGNGYENGGNSYEQGGNSYGGDSYSNGNGGSGGGGNSYSNEGGNSYGSNEGGNSYGSNEGGNSYNSNGGNAYNTPDNGNSYQNGGSDEEQGYHLQSLGYDMSQYTNRAYVPTYSLNSLSSFVHSRFKEIAMKKQRGEYQYTDNPYMNNYENYKSMDVNYAQFVPNQQGGMGMGRKKCSKNHRHNNNQNGGGGSGYNANNDVNFDDSYNNYGMPSMQPLVFYNNNGNQPRARPCKHRHESKMKSFISS